ncbi:MULTISPECIES: hypothetical protein [unclassified Rathayibacter]|nr:MULTISPECIES: hypothetical protein [unclassified Rathayibacter]MBF4463279.1 hypothetical protein [Rathayibacter sp. VKM Ac-2879]MBF4504484.1 hypothetical protein [Rathayibacter sp. VKM Ac-2878]
MSSSGGGIAIVPPPAAEDQDGPAPSAARMTVRLPHLGRTVSVESAG